MPFPVHDGSGDHNYFKGIVSLPPFNDPFSCRMEKFYEKEICN